jgi:hypothetical protein
MDGQSNQYWLGGTRPYSAALWWRQLGPKSSATHFVYDLYFYTNSPGAPQALEFDVNQSVGGHKYIFGTECNYKGTHQWDVWNGAHWVPTGIGCSPPKANTWHHLVWEFHRTSNNLVQFVSVTLDGKKSYINRSYKPIGASAQMVTVAFQEDGDFRQADYSVWLDKIKLYYW